MQGRTITAQGTSMHWPSSKCPAADTGSARAALVEHRDRVVRTTSTTEKIGGERKDFSRLRIQGRVLTIAGRINATYLHSDA